MKLQPKGGGSWDKSWLGKLVLLLPKVPGLLPLVKLLLWPSWREWIFQCLQARIPKRPEAAADFESALERCPPSVPLKRPVLRRQGGRSAPRESARSSSGSPTSRWRSRPRPGHHSALRPRRRTAAGRRRSRPDQPRRFLSGRPVAFLHRQARGLHPDLVDSVIPRALSRRGRCAPLETAELLLRRSIDLETDNFWPYFVLGRTLSAKGDQRGAELAFNSCISLDPDYARGYEQRASHDRQAVGGERRKGEAAAGPRARGAVVIGPVDAGQRATRARPCRLAPRRQAGRKAGRPVHLLASGRVV